MTSARPVNGVPERLIGLVDALREHGVSVGPGEAVDAGAALVVLGMADRDQVRDGLAAALLRRAGHRSVFDALFDLYFPASVGAPDDDGPDAEQRADRTEQELIDALRAALADALAENDQAAQRHIAAQAVDQLGRYGGGSGSVGGGGWSAHQTLERLRPQTLISQVTSRMRGVADGETFTDRLDRDEVRRRVDEFGAMVAAEARRRVAEVRGRDRIAKYAVRDIAEERDFLTADREQLAQLRRAVQPLSRKLATRLAARRRHAHRGTLDLRRTLRRSMSTGGVPLAPAYRRRKPGRPDIVLLCDVSGSVAGFAHFTLALVEALHDQFSRVRAFAFVDAIDEVTHLVAANDADPGMLTERILAETNVVRWDGHSNYGQALRGFVDEYLGALGPRTSVLILGDARNNGGDPNLGALRQIVDSARRVAWLNPEPRSSWMMGDSEANRYRTLVEMHECRNAQQLTQVISGLLPV